MSTLISNAKSTWNKFLGDPVTGVIPKISADITTLMGRTVTVKFFSQVEINDYPCIRSLPLRRGAYLERSNKQEKVMQVDLFAINHDEIVLDLMADKFLEFVGFDLSNLIFHSRIDFKDLINGLRFSTLTWISISILLWAIMIILID
mgnify:CR=1 FL=1